VKKIHLQTFLHKNSSIPGLYRKLWVELSAA
jgi:hypothetical protein